MNDIYVLLDSIRCCKQLQLLFAFLNFKAEFIKFFGWQIHIQLFSVWQLHWEMKGNSTFQVLTSRRCRCHWKNYKKLNSFLDGYILNQNLDQNPFWIKIVRNLLTSNRPFDVFDLSSIVSIRHFRVFLKRLPHLLILHSLSIR